VSEWIEVRSTTPGRLVEVCCTDPGLLMAQGPDGWPVQIIHTQPGETLYRFDKPASVARLYVPADAEVFKLAFVIDSAPAPVPIGSVTHSWSPEQPTPMQDLVLWWDMPTPLPETYSHTVVVIDGRLYCVRSNHFVYSAATNYMDHEGTFAATLDVRLANCDCEGNLSAWAMLTATYKPTAVISLRPTITGITWTT
jgi:hypothetical protein